jgi:hypothetical protein
MVSNFCKLSIFSPEVDPSTTPFVALKEIVAAFAADPAMTAAAIVISFVFIFSIINVLVVYFGEGNFEDRSLQILMHWLRAAEILDENSEVNRAG